MGSLTDVLKCRSVDLFELSKKPKIPSHSFHPAPLPPPRRRRPTRPSAPPGQRFPENLDAFVLGSSKSSARTPLEWVSCKARDTEMGNCIARPFQNKKIAHGREQWSGDEIHEVQDGRSSVLDLPDMPSKVDDAGIVVLDSMPSEEEEKGLDDNDPLYEDDSRKYDDKLSTIKSTKERISTFHSASEDREKKPEEDMHELFSPLTHEEASFVFGAMQGGNSCEVLVKHEASSIEITREVFQCLNYRAWLNEEVINVYLELLKEREKREPERFLKCHFFNTFFYKKLFSGTNCYDFKGVRRWTTQKKLGYGLIECDKIFVPIHKDLHWSLAVINVKEESFEYLDSLGAMDNTVLAILAMYFMDEVKDKSDKQINTLSWKQEAVKDLPLQGNVWDCGMFMLKYADFYSRGLSLCFSQDHMPYFRRRTAKEILSLRAE